MMMGDFNIVMNNSLDIVSGDYHNQNLVERFNSVINELLLNPKEDLETINTMRKLCEKVDVKCDY